jgi:ABC-type phosphate/phosphonate transport system substrate-binding protein
MTCPVRVGAVMYDPKVSVIWEIIGDFFESRSCPIDVTFYSTYERQVTALVDGTLDIAWNSPLAWLDAQRRTGGRCRAIAMRDTDRDRRSHIVGRRDGPVRGLADLRGRSFAAGALDSPQATLIPLELLREHGIDPRADLVVKCFDLLAGKHGDHVGGELEAFRSLERGEAAACAMLDLNWDTWTSDGTIDPGAFEVKASTERFDHCVFTAGVELDGGAEARWLEALFSMRYDDPAHRQMMDLEGLKAWMPGRTTGFRALSAAVEAEGFFENQRPSSQ